MKKQIIKRIAATFLAAAMLVTLIPATDVKAASVTPVNWMSEISDDAKLSEFSIPGTHDSASWHVWLSYVFQCQNTSISKQLTNGFRYLDLRLDLTEAKDGTNEFTLCHNFSTCRETGNPFSSAIKLDSVLSQVYSFLDDNPTETVIVVTKLEKSDDDVSECQKLLYSYIDANPNYWYTKNAVPTMGKVRGKIVLVTRFDDVNNVGNDRCGIQIGWDQQDNTEVLENVADEYTLADGTKFVVQDRFKYDNDSKWDAIKWMLDNPQGAADTLSINFTSVSGPKKLPHPRGNAKKINANLKAYEFERGTNYGIVLFDFADDSYAKLIYETNF